MCVAVCVGAVDACGCVGSVDACGCVGSDGS